MTKPQSGRLSIQDHDRDASAMKYVYPVISRRAGGVSIGINLNPNNACNWRCVYCQVPNLKRGKAPVIDMAQLENELNSLLDAILNGDFMQSRVPPDMQRLNDIALSGNGEPTSAKEFAEVIALIGRLITHHALMGKIKLVLITNGSLISRAAVQEGLKAMANLNGEVWLKLDSASRTGLAKINHTRQSLHKTEEHIAIAAALCPTWIQTCMFAWDGAPPSSEEQTSYLSFLQGLVKRGVPLGGVLLYGLARPSLQAEAEHLSALPASWLHAFGERIKACGLSVKITP